MKTVIAWLLFQYLSRVPDTRSRRIPISLSNWTENGCLGEFDDDETTPYANVVDQSESAMRGLP